MTVASLGYVGLSMQDPSAWNEYGNNILGLMTAADSSAERVLLRMDDHPYRLFVEQGDEDKLICTGWEFADSGAFEAVIANMQAAGVDVHRGDAEGAALRCVTEYAVTADPSGNPVEVYYGRTRLQDDFVSPLGVDSFVTGDMGMGHVVIPAPNQDQTHDFYKTAMGFGDSDELILPPPAEGAPEMRILFMHAANQRHHSLGLFNFPSPTGIVHMIFEVPDIDTVGACLDRANAAEVPMMASLGRHENDNALSFYMFGPGGIGVEYGCEGKLIDYKNYQATKSTLGDIWGHDYAPPVTE